ncbi:MAG: DUF4124 domain-containing protein [Piscirickettsiaceae bacterium]|nr:DUF4124 domain-containing protein [Piscirickettsiaceae bacterium]
MVIPYPRQYCLFLVLLIGVTAVSADVYKWVDQQGETHYSQSPPPQNQKAELIKAPPPPAINPADAQLEVDKLIAQQAEDRKESQEQQAVVQEVAKQEAILRQNCQTAKHNLQQYQDNPGRRYVDEDGNVTRIKEEVRQQKIKDQQNNIQEFCQ